MKIIVTLSALVLIVSLWGCSQTQTVTTSQTDRVTGPCAGMMALAGPAKSRTVTSAADCKASTKNLVPQK